MNLGYKRMKRIINSNSRVLTWLPLVFGPALAILIIPAPVCFKSGWISSSNFELKYDWNFN
jgi:hypothetical protein